MEKKKRGRPAKKKTEVNKVKPAVMPTETFENISVSTEIVRESAPGAIERLNELVSEADHCETFDTLIVSEPAPVKFDKLYFKNKLETLAAEITIAIKEDRSLAIRLKSVYVSINQAAKKL